MEEALPGAEEAHGRKHHEADLANQAKQSAFVANFEEREKVEQRKEMRSILDELIIRSNDGLKADLLELKEKYSNFDAEEKK